MSENNTKKSKSPLLIALVAGIAVVAVLLVVVIVLLMNRGNTEAPQAEEKRNTVVTQENVEEVVEEMANTEYVEPGYYTVSMSTTWHFKTGSDVSEDAYVENLEQNTNDVYFDLFLANDEDRILLKSPVIPRGGQMNNIALDDPLPAGTHDCVAEYHLIDEEQNTISTLRVGIQVIVEE